MEEIQTLPFPDDDRKIFNGVTFVVPQVLPSVIRRAIHMLTPKQLVACKEAMIRRDCYEECKAVRDIYLDAQFQYAWCIRYISALLEKESTMDLFDTSFEIISTDNDWGSVTSVSAQDRRVHYMWGCETMTSGSPDVVTATKDLLECMYDWDDGVESLDPPISKDIRKYHPTGVKYIADTYKPFIDRDGEEFGRDNLNDLVVHSVVKTQVAVDVASTAPVLVPTCTVRDYEAAPGLSKSMNVVTASAADERDFVSNVKKVTKLAASIGSPKKGMGKLRHIHYDGIPHMSIDTRRRYEWLTDYIHQPAQVYLLDTKDVNFAYALKRQIEDDHDEPFIVVYDKKECDKSDEFIGYEKGKPTIFKKGVVGMRSKLWRVCFDKFETYFISFKQPLRTGGSGLQQIKKMQLARQAYHATVASHSKFMYYGFIGSMGEKDLVFSSCRGRDTRVIFTNKGVLDRAHAMYVVMAYVKHSLLYPYLAHTYMHTKRKFYRYPGVRVLCRRYDMSPPSAEERNS